MFTSVDEARFWVENCSNGNGREVPEARGSPVRTLLATVGSRWATWRLPHNTMGKVTKPTVTALLTKSVKAS
ncbi:MAG: hypothetical protein ABGX22_20350 [Pirellulaceae bacterium]